MSTAAPPNPHAVKIAGAIAAQREWRETKASQFPNDLRNVQSAMALSRLESLVRTLPDDDPRVEAIWEAADDISEDQDTIVLGEEASRDLGRVGFDLRVNEAPHDSLISLITALRRENEFFRRVRRADLDRRIEALAKQAVKGKTKVTELPVILMNDETFAGSRSPKEGEPYQRIKVDVTDDNENVMTKGFIGRWLVIDMYPDDPRMDAGWHVSVAQTEKGNFAVYWLKNNDDGGRLDVFESFEELRSAENAPADNILAAVANAIGEDYVEELDI